MLHVLLPSLLLLTGMTGLLDEVVLGRLLALHVGSSGAAQAVVLATFLGGLSAGAWLTDRVFAARLQEPRTALRAWAGLEAFIGLWATTVPWLADALFAALEPLAQRLPAGGGADVALSMTGAVVSTLPLTTAMGATLPVIALAVGGAVGPAGVGLLSRCYAVNAAGGALGAWIAGFWAIEALGLHAPLAIGGASNLLVAAIAWLLARNLPLASERPVDAGAPAARVAADRGAAPAMVLVVAAFATGMVTLVDEVVWVRMAALLLGASAQAFAWMLVIVIVGVAGGSALATAAIERGQAGRRVLVASQAAAGVFGLILALRLAALPDELLVQRLSIPPKPENYGWWLLQGGGWLALHLLPAALALGASFPSLLAAACEAGAALPRATAWLLGANTAGNLAGALTGGFLWMPLLGLERVLVLGAAASFAVAGLALGTRRAGASGEDAAAGRRDGHAARAAFALAAVVALVGLVAPPDVGLLYHGLYRTRAQPGRPLPSRDHRDPTERSVFREDGKDASITVDGFRHGDAWALTFATNGKPDGSSAESLTQAGLGLVGLLAAPEARDVFVVGLGTGQSAAAAAALDGARVRVAELSPAVLDVARLFADFNGDVLAQPNVHIEIADARTVLQRSAPGSFDMIVSEPSNPWVVGVPDLFTVETFDLVRRALRPNGVMVQWLQSYEMSDETFRSVLCTVATAFPEVRVVRLEPGDVALVAAMAPLPDDQVANALDLVATRLQGERLQAWLSALPDPRLFHSLDELLALEIAGPARVRAFCAGFDAPLTLARPRIEYQAPRDFFAGLTPSSSLRALDGRMAEPQAMLLARRWRHHAPDAATREAVAAFLERLHIRVDVPVIAGLRAGTYPSAAD